MQFAQDIFTSDFLISKIQSRVGIFLTLRERLKKIESQTLDLNIKTRAQELLTVQDVLEEEFQNVLSVIERIKSGSLSFSDIAKVGSFYYEMESQISDVENLESKFKEAPKSESVIGTKTLLLLAGVILYVLMRR